MIDFTRPISNRMYWPDHRDFRFETVSDITESFVNVQKLSFTTHMGTHIDAPYHVHQEGRTIDEFPIEKFIGSGAIVPVNVQAGKEITIEDVDLSVISPVDILFISTGWEDEYHNNQYTNHPHFSEGLAQELVDFDIDIVGVDMPTVDLASQLRPDGWTKFPVHKKLLKNGVLIIENLHNLNNLGVQKLKISAIPIKISGGDGAPIRVFGWEKGEINGE